MSTNLAANSIYKILVVDDNPVIVKALSLKLESAGYRVVSAVDGSEAIALVRSETPSLILLDLNFPPELSGVQWDGYRILEWLARLDSTKNIPVIVITSSEAAEAKERALKLGARAYFSKPLEPGDLLKLISSLLVVEK